MRKTIKKYAVTLILILMPVFFTACTEYVDLDKVIFITSILVDQDDDGANMVFYFETLTAMRSSSKESNEEKRIVYKIKCNNGGDAINLLEAQTSTRITLAHNKILLFTERFAKNGVDQCFDLFDRRQAANTRTLIGIFAGSPKDFLEPNHPEEEITGLYLYEMLGTVDSFTSVGVRVEVKEFTNQVLVGDRVNSVPIVNVITDEDTKGQYDLDGLGLIKEYKMIGRLSKDESFYFNLMLNNEVAGDIMVPNPQDEDKIVSMLFLSDTYDTHADYQDGVLKITREFVLKTNITAVQGKLKLTDDNIKKMEIDMADKIKGECMALFDEWKEKKTDIFDIQEEFERKYPSYKNLNIIEDTELQLDVKVIITGTVTVKDAK